MAQDLFILKLSDGETTIDFIGPANPQTRRPYRLADGGFDISLPHAERNLAMIRDGFYVPVSAEYSYRESRLRFEVNGASRSEVLSRLHTIERVLRNVSSRSKGLSSAHGELQYAWKGANDITYFEVYGGDLSFASDVLSVAKVHGKQTFIEGTAPNQVAYDEYFLPECELTLLLSPYGFGLSLNQELNTADMEIPLANPYSSNAFVKGGVKVMNDRTNQYSYVNIKGDDLRGTQPMVCKIQLDTDNPYYRWNSLYMGVQHGPNYPTRTIFDDSELYYIGGASAAVVGEGYAQGGSYKQFTFSGRVNRGVLPTFSWYLTKETKGMFYSFLNFGTPCPDNIGYSIGVDDYIAWGVRYQEDFVSPRSRRMSIPLGAIQLPPTHIDLGNYADELDWPLSLSMYITVDDDRGGAFAMDSVSMLPIEHGLRVLHSRMPSGRIEAGTYVDDAWRGLEYFKYFDVQRNTNYVAGVIFGMMEPIRLDPGIDQRIYFHSVGDSMLYAEQGRSFKVRVFAVPTYLTLAM